MNELPSAAPSNAIAYLFNQLVETFPRPTNLDYAAAIGATANARIWTAAQLSAFETLTGFLETLTDMKLIRADVYRDGKVAQTSVYWNIVLTPEAYEALAGDAVRYLAQGNVAADKAAILRYVLNVIGK